MIGGVHMMLLPCVRGCACLAVASGAGTEDPV